MKAPAKINLFLRVLNQRNNGYHNVEMVMQSVDLCDEITICKTSNKKISVSSNCDFLNDLDNNSAYVAANLFFNYTKINDFGIDIYIKKQIPCSAGLAGGSSDAAAVLLGLNVLFDQKLFLQDLAKIAEKIGADVPFCLFGGTMLAEGVGTKLTKLNAISNCYIVIVKPDMSISTKIAYSMVNNLIQKNNKKIDKILKSIEKQNLKNISKNLYNQFDEIMNISEIKDIKKYFCECGAINSCMSGTGSATFGIFDNKNLAVNCKNMMSKRYKNVFLTRPIEHGCHIIQ